MAEKLARTRAKCSGNRSVMKKLSNEANDLLQIEPINKRRLEFTTASPNEKLNLVKTFEDKMIENCAVDEIEAEVEESDEMNSRIKRRLVPRITTQEFRLSQLRMSTKLLPLVRMQTKLQPLVFNN